MNLAAHGLRGRVAGREVQWPHPDRWQSLVVSAVDAAVAILDTQAIGVALGALIALGATTITDRVRSRREGERAARDARKAVHVDMMRSLYAFREAAREFRKIRLEELPKAPTSAEVESAHSAYVQAGVVFGEQRFLTMALGYNVVANTATMLGSVISAWAMEGYGPFEEQLAEEDPELFAEESREEVMNSMLIVLLGMIAEDSKQTRVLKESPIARAVGKLTTPRA
jgi:hypothetical protein